MGKKPGAKVSFNETGLLRYVPCSADMRDVDFEEAAQGDAAFRKIFRHGKGLAKNPAEMANSPGSKINNRRMTTSFSSIHLKEGEGITYQIEHVMEEDDYIEPVPRNPGWEGDDDEILDELSGQFEVKVQLAPESAGITDRMLKCWIEPLNNSAKVLLGCKNTSCSVTVACTDISLDSVDGEATWLTLANQAEVMLDFLTCVYREGGEELMQKIKRGGAELMEAAGPNNSIVWEVHGPKWPDQLDEEDRSDLGAWRFPREKCPEAYDRAKEIMIPLPDEH
eukprot:CAMPEP_0197865014 /NCGR_PEP_ID=MMETSP1438-20131217/43420_1 /TAXON_ID=1461541 /ORGANISM="Pterosperma sp., Strain CCMP1384" /LENGTH=279 /DNA_ID=CAMNT_0043483411 /DNA_START=193 /DNA_END=1032 /DNA_ORIENTATION=-